MQTLDPDLLKTFLAFVDSGSLAQAASIVGRSPSAVTAQMQRLEDIAGEPLLVPQGRGRILTPAGEDLVGHARRILAVHREAWLALKGVRADGRVAVGTTQDFADSGLPDLLRAFAASYPRVRIELRVGRSAELAEALQTGTLDLMVAMRQAPAPDEIGVLREPMMWLCSQRGLATRQDELPLALLDPHCGFREAAIAALDSGRPPLPHRRRQCQPGRAAHGGECRHCSDAADGALCPFRHRRGTARLWPAAGSHRRVRHPAAPGCRAPGPGSGCAVQRQPCLGRRTKLISQKKKPTLRSAIG